jgi:hypothetical protein
VICPPGAGVDQRTTVVTAMASLGMRSMATCCVPSAQRPMSAPLETSAEPAEGAVVADKGV